MAPLLRFPIKTYSFLLYYFIATYVVELLLDLGFKYLPPNIICLSICFLSFQVLAILLIKTNNRSLHAVNPSKHYLFWTEFVIHFANYLHVHVWNILHHFFFKLMKVNFAMFCMCLWLTQKSICVITSRSMYLKF